MTINTTWTDPSDAGTLDLDTGDTLTETVWDAMMSNIKRLGGTAGLLQTTDAGLVLVNDTSNAKSTIGLTINQGANDDEAVALKSSDIAHGITDWTETDTYGALGKSSATAGGLKIFGYSEATTGVEISGFDTTDDTTHGTTGKAAVIVSVAKKSGTTIGAHGTNGNLFAVLDNGVTRFIVDAEGDTFQDGTAGTAYDAFDDVALLNAVQGALVPTTDPIRQQFRAYLDEHRDVLERTRLVCFDDETGHHFVNTSGLIRLLVGAVRQLGAQKATLEDRLARIESRLAALPEGGR